MVCGRPRYFGQHGHCVSPAQPSCAAGGDNTCANGLHPVHSRMAHAYITGRQCVKNPSTKPILTYFDVIGLAEQTRLCFIIGEVPFVDRRVTEEEWVKHYKAYSPTGRAPYLEVDGEVLVESRAVMHYAACRAGLLPATAESRMKADMIIETTETGIAALRRKIPGDLPREEYKQRMVEMMKDALPEWFVKYENNCKEWVDLEKGETWLVGNRMSQADVYVASVIYGAQSFAGFKEIPDVEKFPVLSKIYSGVMEHPRVAAYIAERQRKDEKLVLYHFDTARSYTSAIEWALKIGHIDYEEKAIAKEQWDGELKEKSPTGKLPMLEVGGEKYVGTVALLQYVAKRADLMPPCDLSVGHALAVVKVCSDIWNIGMQLKNKEGNEKKEAIEKAVNVTIPEALARVEEVVGHRQDHEGHVVGKKLSYADLWVAQTFAAVRNAARLHGIKITNLETLAPKMFKTYRLVMAVPEISQHEGESMARVKPVLTYFDLSGRGEACRYAMLIAGIEFEDRRITWEDWIGTYKSMSPTGQCPFLTVGQGQIIPEAKAILQWVCEIKPELIPTDATERVIAEELVSSWSRVHIAMRKLYEVPIEERDALKPKIRDEFVMPAMEIQEKLWKDCNVHEGYSVGDKMTWVDCWVAGEIEYHAGWGGVMAKNWQEKFPTLAHIFRRVTTHERVANYRAAHC